MISEKLKIIVSIQKLKRAENAESRPTHDVTVVRVPSHNTSRTKLLAVQDAPPVMRLACIHEGKRGGGGSDIYEMK